MLKRILAAQAAVLLVGLALAQTGARAAVPSHEAAMSRAAVPHFASNMIVPQSRSFVVRPNTNRVEIRSVTIGAVIVEGVATTTMDVFLENPSAAALEAELLVPVPDGAVVRSFDFEGSASESTARLLPAAEAKQTYDAIVRKARDPALLEFAGSAMVRSSVFPVPARGKQRVRLTYEHLLDREGGRLEYVIPRTESLELSTVPWTVSVRIRSKRSISTAYSPTHAIETSRRSGGAITVKIAKAAAKEPGPFRLYALLEKNGLTASLLAYPEAKGGYFLLLAAPPASLLKKGAIKREVTVVLDRSGSMAGEKLEQARAAALQIVEGLEDGEAFNIIDYSSTVSLLAPRPMLKTTESTLKAREYLRAMRARGGTNLHDAVIEALRQPRRKDFLGIVLLMTDGLPTVGVTREVELREAAKTANVHERRVFTFGVGYDVNSALLSNLAEESRARSTFILPEEDVELKVAALFQRLSGPVLSSPVLEMLDERGRVTTTATRDVLPAKLQDLFEDDQIVVLGRYVEDKPLRFRLKGNYLGRERTFEFRFPLEGATTRNAFVPRLWASRRIGVLIDAIRQAGAEEAVRPRTRAGGGGLDPRMKELVDEIVRLSTEFGILTEYTAFFASEGTPLERDEVLRQAEGNLSSRAVRTRGGQGGVNQDLNNDFQRFQKNLNGRNFYWDENMRRVEVSNVQQVADRAFFRRGNRWVDARLLAGEKDLPEARRVKFGSEAYAKITEALTAEGRNGVLMLNGDAELDLLVNEERLVLEAPAPAGK